MKGKTLATSNGSALFITLSAVVLLTVIILAFFSRAELSRKISFSSTNQIRTRMLVASARDIITGQLREQIVDGSLSGASYTQGNTAVYVPKDAHCVGPKRQSGLEADPVGVNTILYVSGTGSTLNPYAPSPLQLGSSVSIDTPSRNGRKESNWYSGGPRLGNAQTPSWVYLTQGAGVATVPLLSARATEPGYVVGRFAYTVYDVSGLLDANVAGYPSTMDSDSNRHPSFKSCHAYVNLSVEGLGANADQLASWRTPENAASASAYKSYLDNWGLKYGFQQTKVGCNAFLSRLDFLNAIDHGIAGFSGTSAAYFTANTCSVDAPSWSPLTPAGSSVNYASLAETGTSVNPNIPNVRFPSSGNVTHYRDDGTFYTYAVKEGDSLIQRRFSLAKLAWITDLGPKDGISAQAIQACFGLAWDTANKRWNYVGASGVSMRNSIATLKNAADEMREPNFFELLQAGILSSSLGKAATNNSLASTLNFDKNSTLQIIQIGANIIDQYDTDDYPTVIQIMNNQNNQAWDAFGIEDLPYLLSLYTTYYRPTNAAAAFPNNASRDNVHIWMMVELWNPHQSSRNGSLNLRARVNEGKMAAMVAYSGSTGNIPRYGTSRDFETSPAALDFSCKPWEFREPTLLTRVNSSGTTGDIFSDGVANLAGFHIGSVNAPDKTLTGASTDYHWEVSYFHFDMPMTVELMYQHPTLGWLPYHRLEGITDAYIGGNMPKSDDNTSPSITPPPRCYSYTYVYPDGLPYLCRSLSKPDPRATRFGLYGCVATNKSIGATQRPERTSSGWQSEWGTPTKPSFQHTEGTATFNPYPQFGRPGMWADNNPSNGVTPNSYYSGNDGIVRPGDGYYGAYPQAQNTSLDQSARPRILNRPFCNVAELGYVFRDEPFKTLDLFSGKSADSGLEDLFCVIDQPEETAVAAGKINVNAADQNVLTAVLSNAFVNNNASSTISQAQARSIAEAIVSCRAASASGPVRDPGDWGRWLGNEVLDTALTGDDKRLKERRESVIRASASSIQTRTWNLLIDVTAQSGRFTRNTTDVGDFVVEGSQRCWFHVAIDRFTGKIIRQTTEVVSN